jgi:hypothetical protein
MDADNVDERPEQSEAEHRPGVVQVDGLRAAHRERPVQAWELRRLVRKWTRVDHGLEEFVHVTGDRYKYKYFCFSLIATCLCCIYLIFSTFACEIAMQMSAPVG